MAPDDAFYVGYAPRAPRDVARFVRRVVIALACVALVLPLVLLAAQEPFAPAAFEFGTLRRYRGTVYETPVPHLLLRRPAAAGPDDASQLLLVAPGKHGAAAAVRGLDGRVAEVRGTLVYRDGTMMLELDGEAVVASEGAPAAQREPVAADLGNHVLRGEIVDSKCHLGVMRPGEGKPHRQCAARCLAGGIPPMLHVAGEDGVTARYLLVGADGRAIGRELLDRVAEPVEVPGRVERRGTLLFLFTEPADVRRIGEEPA